MKAKRVIKRVSKVVSNAASNIAKSYETFVEHIDGWKHLTRTTRYSNSSYSEMMQTLYGATQHSVKMLKSALKNKEHASL